MLNDVVVEFRFGAFEQEFHGFAGGFGGIANGSRKPRVEIADRHHAGSRNFVLQVVREFRELVDIGIHPAHECLELRENFGDVRRNFSQGPRQDIDVVVAVHLELAELEQIARHDSRRRRSFRAESIHLRRLAAGNQRPADAAELVFLLELRNFSGEPALREIQDFDEFR